MTTRIKSNAFVMIFCILFISLFVVKPDVFMQSTLRGLMVWLNSVLPSLFPFFVVSKLLTNSMPPFKSVSANIFAISIVSGYPVGAKLLADKCRAGEIDGDYCTRALALCSTSGPLFLLGAVGIGIFHSYKAGIVLLVSHILGSVANGLIYFRKSRTKMSPTLQKSINIGDTMYDSIISILMVGGFIALCFVVVDMLVEFGVIGMVASAVGKVFGLNADVVSAVLCGSIEMTRGCVEIANTGVSMTTALTICSALIGSGAVSVFLQTVCFLPPAVKRGRLIVQKLTQAVLCALFCLVICLVVY